MKSRIHKGPFLKPCPCTPGAVSCGLWNANIHTGCPFRCSYCILQEYLTTMDPIVFRNWRSIGDEIDSLAGQQKELRVTSGELSDSLAFPQLAPMTEKVLSLIAEFPSVIFEFKTKSEQMASLLSRRRVLANAVVSWSLSPQALIASEETGTSPLRRRLTSMTAVADKGYKIGIHFDPLILFPGWREHYRRLVTQISRTVPAGRIAWWSLGGLRFNPSLKPHIFKRRRSRLFWGELVPGFDGKYRYFKPLRLELFRFVIAEIQSRISSEIPLYLCMEDDEAWQHLFPRLSLDPASINRILYRSVFAR